MLVSVPIPFQRGSFISHCVATMGSITNPAPLNNTTAILDFVFAIRTSIPMYQFLETIHKDGTTRENIIPFALIGFRVCGHKFLVIPFSEFPSVKLVDITRQRRFLFLRELKRSRKGIAGDTFGKISAALAELYDSSNDNVKTITVAKTCDTTTTLGTDFSGLARRFRHRLRRKFRSRRGRGTRRRIRIPLFRALRPSLLRILRSPTHGNPRCGGLLRRIGALLTIDDPDSRRFAHLVEHIRSARDVISRQGTALASQPCQNQKDGSPESFRVVAASVLVDGVDANQDRGRKFDLAVVLLLFRFQFALLSSLASEPTDTESQPPFTPFMMAMTESHE